jgi:2-methylcitrate dehydratase PrpD
VSLEQFDGQAWADARVQSLLPRIVVAGYDDTQFDAANHFGGAVRVTLKDGRVHEAQVEQPLGRTSSHPLPQPLLEAKFALCAGTVLEAGAVHDVAATVARIEDLEDVRLLSRQLARITTA